MGQVLWDIVKKLVPICLGAMLVVLVMDIFANKVLTPERIMAEGFYYGAIIFALLHLVNKKKRLDREVKAEASAQTGEAEDSEDAEAEPAEDDDDDVVEEESEESGKTR